MLIGIVIVTGIASVGVIAAGGAAGVTIAALDQGLPDVKEFRDLDFSEPTTIYRPHPARWSWRSSGTSAVRSSTSRTSRRSSWTSPRPPRMTPSGSNPGFDLQATVSAFLTAPAAAAAAAALRPSRSSSSVHACCRRTSSPGTTRKEGLYLRKAKELLQSYKLTQAFPGEEGKKAIITAYLNEISYGAAQGIAAAADIYLGKSLDELTVSEAALLAAIPQSPASLYPWATDGKGHYRNVVQGVVRQEEQERQAQLAPGRAHLQPRTTRNAWIPS